MLVELEAAIRARLENTPLTVLPPNILKDPAVQPVARQRISAPVSFQLPEDWLRTSTSPSLNIWRMSLEPSRTYRRVGIHERVKERDDGSGLEDDRFVQTKPHRLPFAMGYEFGIRADYQENIVDLIMQFYTRFPAIGFGSQVLVTLDGESVPIFFTQQTYQDLTPAEKSGEREFEVRLSYIFDPVWLDAAEWTTVRSIKTVRWLAATPPDPAFFVFPTTVIAQAE